VLARRIIAVSPDKGFGKQLATALKAAGGVVDLHLKLEDLSRDIVAALVVLHLDGEMATAAAEILPRLTGDAKVIAILPRSNLAAVVDVMQSSDRIAGILVAENFDSRHLSAMATRVVAGDIFGLEKMIVWGTLVHSQLVGDYQEKSLCIAQISDFAETMGVRRKYREAIEQCLDEMLMNALYDAPVDEQGRPIFSEIPTKTRISLRVEQKVVVQYACDGKQFVVSVRDAFGTLERNTVLRYLYKCLHAEQQIDRKVGGAGLGLYLMLNSATTVYFNVLPGVATEATCVFDLDSPKIQIERFGYFTEKIDAGGRLAAGPARRLPAGTGHPVERRRAPQAATPPRGLIAALTIAIFAIVGLIGVVAWPRLFPAADLTQVTFKTVPPGATIEIEGRNRGTASKDGTLVVPDLEIGRAYPVVAKLDGYEPKTAVVQPQHGTNQVLFELQARSATVYLDTQPTGATVEVDGKPVGTTPVALNSLPSGSKPVVKFKKTGYDEATATLEVPPPGKEMHFLQPLSISDNLARVKLVSEPAGAHVHQNGQLLAGVMTPAEVIVEAGKPQRFVLTMKGHVPAVIDPFVPGRGSTGITKTAKLVPGHTLRVESTIEGSVNVAPSASCKGVPTPAECVLPTGKYSVELTTQGGRAMHQVNVARDAVERFELGYVEAGPGKQLQVAGKAVPRAVLEAGPRSVTVLEDGNTRTVQVKVKAGGTVTAN